VTQDTKISLQGSENIFTKSYTYIQPLLGRDFCRLAKWRAVQVPKLFRRRGVKAQVLIFRSAPSKFEHDLLRIVELRRLIAGFPLRRPGFDPRSCGICGGQSDTGACFLRALRFPLPILIPPTTPHSSTIRGWYNGTNIGDIPSGLSLTPPQETILKKTRTVESRMRGAHCTYFYRMASQPAVTQTTT
jgi:hypothetical protein